MTKERDTVINGPWFVFLRKMTEILDEKGGATLGRF